MDERYQGDAEPPLDTGFVEIAVVGEPATESSVAPLVPATVAAMNRKASERLKGVASHLQNVIAQQVHVKHPSQAITWP